MLDVSGSMSGAPVAAMERQLTQYWWLLIDFNLIHGNKNVQIHIFNDDTKLLLKPTGRHENMLRGYVDALNAATSATNWQIAPLSGKHWLQ